MLGLILEGQEEVGELKHGLEDLEDKEDFDFQDGMDSDEDSFEQSDDEDDEGTVTGSESGDAESIAAEGVVGLHDSSSSEDSGGDETPSSLVDVTTKRNTIPPPKNGDCSQAQLDDAFFNLASFNAETERAEAMTSSSGHLGGDGDSDSDISVDLFAPLDQTEYSHDDIEEEGGRHFGSSRSIQLTLFLDVFYHDFFDPPPASLSRAQKTKLKSNSFSPSSSQVRFHDEVKVLKIKARGYNPAVSTLENKAYSEDDEDEDSTFVEQGIRPHGST